MSTIAKINKRKDKETILKWAEREGINLNTADYDGIMEDFDQRFRGYYKDLKDLVKEELKEQDIPEYIEIDMNKTVAKAKTEFKVIELNDSFAVFDF